MENQNEQPKTYEEIIEQNERYEQMKKQYQKCLHCVWGNPIDGTVICAFPYCVMR